MVGGKEREKWQKGRKEFTPDHTVVSTAGRAQGLSHCTSHFQDLQTIWAGKVSETPVNSRAEFGQLFIKLCCLFCRCSWAVSWGCTGYCSAKAAPIKSYGTCAPSFMHCALPEIQLSGNHLPANDLQIEDLFDAEIADISTLYLWRLSLAEIVYQSILKCSGRRGVTGRGSCLPEEAGLLPEL